MLFLDLFNALAAASFDLRDDVGDVSAVGDEHPGTAAATFPEGAW